MELPQPEVPSLEVPLPDPIRPATPGQSAPEATPRVLYDVMLLPEPVRRMREMIMAACKAGDVEALRALLSTGANATQLSLAAVEGDRWDEVVSATTFTVRSAENATAQLDEMVRIARAEDHPFRNALRRVPPLLGRRGKQ